jgi:hypothetical protein
MMLKKIPLSADVAEAFYAGKERRRVFREAGRRKDQLRRERRDRY